MPRVAPPVSGASTRSLPAAELGSACRWLLFRAKHRVISIVDKGLVAFGRQLLGMAEGALDIVAPDLARQLVKDLDAIAVRVADVEAVGHAVIDAAVKLDPLAAQEGELLEPRFAVRHRDRDMVDGDRRLEHVPILGRRWQIRVLAEGDVVVVHLPAVVAAIKAHLAVAPQRQADLLETEDLGPESMRFLDV